VENAAIAKRREIEKRASIVFPRSLECKILYSPGLLPG